MNSSPNRIKNQISQVPFSICLLCSWFWYQQLENKKQKKLIKWTDLITLTDIQAGGNREGVRKATKENKTFWKNKINTSKKYSNNLEIRHAGNCMNAFKVLLFIMLASYFIWKSNFKTSFPP